MPGTVGYSDIYGGAGPGTKQGEMPAPQSQQASGSAGPSATRPAFFWAGMVALLIALRILWEKG